MSWLAAHQSPAGVLNRFTFASREPAAMALCAAMSHSGARDAWQGVRQLAASKDDTDFIARIDGHWFALSRGDTAWAGWGVLTPEACVAPSMSSSVGADDASPNLDGAHVAFPGNVGAAFLANTSTTVMAEPSLPEIYGARQ